MQCQKCKAQIEPDEAHQHAGQTLCEDCYMDALSPARACDPWAVYLGSRQTNRSLSPGQEKIMEIIRRHRTVDPKDLLAQSGLSAKELERELAALRHMELVRAAPTPGGGKVIMEFADRG